MNKRGRHTGKYANIIDSKKLHLEDIRDRLREDSCNPGCMPHRVSIEKRQKSSMIGSAKEILK